MPSRRKAVEFWMQPHPRDITARQSTSKKKHPCLTTAVFPDRHRRGAYPSSPEREILRYSHITIGGLQPAMSARAVAPAVAAASKTVTKSTSGVLSREMSGIVVSAGLAKNTVKVQVAKEEWNKKVKKVRKPTCLRSALLLPSTHPSTYLATRTQTD